MFGDTDLVPDMPLLNTPAQGAPLMLLFGIFFPAVPGFTAGVQMSGDLKDPGKAIPVGTITAISVGFFVYIGLAVLFSYRINEESLIGNTNILSEVRLLQITDTPVVFFGLFDVIAARLRGESLRGLT